MSTERSEKSVSKKSQELNVVVELPKAVSAKFDSGAITITGPLGKVTQDFSKIPVDVNISGSKVGIVTHGARRKNRSILNTGKSLIVNAVEGVTKGYQYKLKVIYAHFPVTVKVQGKRVLVENFYGERSPRIAEIVGDTKAEVQGEDIVLNGVSIQDVGQTAANLEQATTVKRKDQRVFLDGVYVYERIRK
ncbi:MAG: 50S ribosomal protein L6 [Nitrososphaerota archaeon]|nr:50S ribosomal protein L6 [Nitrososphaerota archaeon]MDG6922542.1 50S ribosomal protein L6 [Nitrososphaerota archaeon]